MPMGPFEEVIGGMHAGGSLYAKFLVRAPWGIRFSTGPQARLVVVARGGCWLRWGGSKTPLVVETGDCLIVKPGVAFDLSDARQRKAISCESLGVTHDGYVVEYGGTGEPTELLIGRFSFDAVAAEPLVAPMPPLVHVSLEKAHADLVQTTLALMGKEMAQDRPGARLVVDRLTDALFVQAMRALFSEGCSFAPGWATALTDGRVVKAIRAVHADITRPWTVAQMAHEAGMSRSSFAVAFTSAVGESPLDYVTNWRIYRAKVLLSSSSESLPEIATRVGYDSDTALSRAFRRKVGIPPGAFRRRVSAERGPRL
ncbi:AraC family transcriptional regulator [Polyangium sp. 6x1]|uniref:AraC family transcriptional regulator n=1 Tax=Polyangium sp. 6x1 TaxID=3042689 RepID=UPI00248329E9|nr:AraC family transcriptional regulator [Polyangium sp. 6x1]MDI1449115.1 AraC family transcriptional regulator [Polyangium sp. 6x1]